ncbi:hypothetical protein [Candidatus Enterococcus lemimoniae]|uniref:LXG domain-containing protein n=1 Tax=Candidatus Enterococcus lemimoniae TaxID=1834167 RepID=A0ABZ2T9V8_9ENTE|nr:hypothetical protein [Enterococcus sp. 12C11_DIV0727]OTO69913.1 hypothetical protein A5866_002131 [Enterococcus sp. 12C11_DIV0727]
MSIDMYLGQARSQASSVKNACSQLVQGYTSLMQSNQQFMSAGELSSKGYDSAKEFFAAVIQPLVQGAEVGADMTTEACQKFVDQYTSEVDSIDLKSDDLERRIRQINTSILNMESINRGLPKLPTGTNPLEQANRRIIESLETTKRDLEKKLEKLMTFNGTSPAIFDGVNSFYSTLSQGLQQANSGFNPATGTFSVPKGKALDWTNSVKSAVRKRNERELDKIVKNLPNIGLAEYQKIGQALKDDPSIKIPKELGEFFKENGVDYAIGGVQDTLLSYFEEYLSKVAPAITSFFTQNGGYASTNIAAASGFAATSMLQGAAKMAGPVIGFTTDILNGNSVGQAISHTGGTIAIGTGLTMGLEATLFTLGVSNPVGWAAIGTAVAIGITANIIYDSNFLGIKDLADDWAKGFDENVERAKNGLNKLGESISSGWDSLTSCFGW